MLHTALMLVSLYVPQDREDFERRRADLERKFKQAMAEMEAKFRAEMEALERDESKARGRDERPEPKGDLAREVRALRAEVQELRAVVEALKGGGDRPKEEPNLHHMRERILNALKNAEGDEAAGLKQKLERVENALRKNPDGGGGDRERMMDEARALKEAYREAEGEKREHIMERLKEIERALGGGEKKRDEHREAVVAEIEALRAKLKEAEGPNREEIEARIRELKKKLGGGKEPPKKEKPNPDAIRREIEELHGALENAEGEKAERIEERIRELKQMLDKMEKPRKKEPDHVMDQIRRAVESLSEIPLDQGIAPGDRPQLRDGSEDAWEKAVEAKRAAELLQLDKMRKARQPPARRRVI